MIDIRVTTVPSTLENLYLDLLMKCVTRYDMGEKYQSFEPARGRPGRVPIIEDDGAIPGCRAAVEDYRARNGVQEPIRPIDWSGVIWQRAR